MGSRERKREGNCPDLAPGAKPADVARVIAPFNGQSEILTSGKLFVIILLTRTIAIAWMISLEFKPSR